MHFRHFRSDHSNVHRFTLFIAEREAIVLADGTAPICQIHIDPGIGNLFHHRGRALNVHRRIVQHILLCFGDIAVLGGADKIHLHIHRLGNFLFHGNGNLIRVSALFIQCIVGHITGINDLIIQFLDAGTVNLGQIHLHGDIIPVNLNHVGSIAGNSQIHCGIESLRDHQSPFVQRIFTLEYHRNVGHRSGKTGTYRGNHIQPHAKCNGQRQQRRPQLVIFHFRCPPLQCRPADFSACPEVSGQPQAHPRTVPCAASAPGSGGPDAA